MKKFSDSDSVIAKKYAGGQILRNRLYDTICERLSVSVDGTVDGDLSLGGKEELVEALVSFIDKGVLKSNMETLRTISHNNKL